MALSVNPNVRTQTNPVDDSYNGYLQKRKQVQIGGTPTGQPVSNVRRGTPGDDLNASVQPPPIVPNPVVSSVPTAQVAPSLVPVSTSGFGNSTKATTTSVPTTTTTVPTADTSTFSDPDLKNQINDLQKQLDQAHSMNIFGDQTGAAKQAFINQIQSKLDDLWNQYGQEKSKFNLNSSYGAAQGALQPAETADVNEYNRLSPLAQRKLIGSLNARGLGSSLAAGGSGSGAYSELLNRQAQGLENLQAGYQDMSNNLDRQKASDNIDLDAFYSQLAQQRAYARQLQQAQNGDIFTNLLSLAPAALSLL